MPDFVTRGDIQWFDQLYCDMDRVNLHHDHKDEEYCRGNWVEAYCIPPCIASAHRLIDSYN